MAFFVWDIQNLPKQKTPQQRGFLSGGLKAADWT
jgi:hypothetical protein